MSLRNRTDYRIARSVAGNCGCDYAGTSSNWRCPHGNVVTGRSRRITFLSPLAISLGLRYDMSIATLKHEVELLSRFDDDDDGQHFLMRVPDDQLGRPFADIFERVNWVKSVAREIKIDSNDRDLRRVDESWLRIAETLLLGKSGEMGSILRNHMVLNPVVPTARIMQVNDRKPWGVGNDVLEVLAKGNMILSMDGFCYLELFPREMWINKIMKFGKLPTTHMLSEDLHDMRSDRTIELHSIHVGVVHARLRRRHFRINRYVGGMRFPKDYLERHLSGDILVQDDIIPDRRSRYNKREARFAITQMEDAQAFRVKNADLLANLRALQDEEEPLAILSPEVVEEDDTHNRQCKVNYGYCWLEAFPLRYHQDLYNLPGSLHLSELLNLANKFSRDFDHDEWVFAVAHISKLLHDHVMEPEFMTAMYIHSALDASLSMITSPVNQQVIEAHFMNAITPAKLRVEKICPYHIPVDNRVSASELSIPWSSRYGDTHPHPIHAALRRMILSEEMPKFMTAPTTLVSFSDSNYRMVERSVSVPLSLMNPVRDVKDLGRFDLSDVTTNFFSLDPIVTPICASLGNGHFYKPENVAAAFRASPSMRVLILNHEFPLSSMVSDRSPQPLLYTFEVKGDKMVYVPEGDHGGKYVQPATNPTLLCHQIRDVGSGEMYYGSVVFSKLNTHVQVWTRYSLNVDQCLPLGMPSFMRLPKVFRSQPDSALIPVLYYKRLYEYGKVINFTEKDLWGKMRQQTDIMRFDLTIIEKVLLTSVVYEVLRISVLPDLPKKHYDNLFSEIWYKTFGHLSRLKSKVMSKRYFVRTAKMIKEPNSVQTIWTKSCVVNAKPSDYQDMNFAKDESSAESLWDRVKANVLYVLNGDHTKDRKISNATNDFVMPNPRKDGIAAIHYQNQDAIWTWREGPIEQVPSEKVKPVEAKDVRNLGKPNDIRPESSENSSETIVVDEPNSDFDKLRQALSAKSLPRFTFKDGASLRQKWDRVFPLSVDRRHLAEPYVFHQFPNVYEWPKQDCLFKAVSEASGLSKWSVLLAALKAWPISQKVNDEDGYVDSILHAVGCNFALQIVGEGELAKRLYGVRSETTISIRLDRGHYTPGRRFSGMMIKPVKQLVESPNQAELLKEVGSLPMITFKEWYPEKSRAEAYVREAAKGTTGTFHAYGINAPALKAWEELVTMAHKENRPRLLAVVEGDPGCRKSSALQRILRSKKYQHGMTFQVSLPTNVLANDWKDKLGASKVLVGTGKGLPDLYCTTFEKSLAMGHPSVLYVTDEDKLPYGHMSLKALLYSDVTHFVRLGDRYQAQWHEPNSDCLLNDMSDPGEGEFYSAYSESYLEGTWRFGHSVANWLSMPSFSHNKTSFHITDRPVVDASELVKYLPQYSLAAAETLLREAISCYPAETDVRAADGCNLSKNMTHSSTQGRGEDLVIVNMTEAALKVMDHRTLYASLTRAKKHLIVVLMYQSSGSNLQLELMSPVFSSLSSMKVDTANVYEPVSVKTKHAINMKTIIGDLPTSVKRLLSGPPSKITNRDFLDELDDTWMSRYQGYIDPDSKESKGGHNQLSRDDPVYKDSPQFLANVTPIQEMKISENQPKDRGPIEDKMKTHLPVESKASWVELNVSRIIDRSERELGVYNTMSNQFPDHYLLKHNHSELLRSNWNAAKTELKNTFGSIGNYRQSLMSKVDSENFLLFKPRLMSYGQNQDPNDNTSFRAGITQRIRFSSLEHNEYMYRTQTSVFGVELFEGLKRCLECPNQVPFDQILMEQSIAEFYKRRADRPTSLKKASIPRSEPDFRNFLTAKRQLKMKDELPPKAKPLQTILLHGDEYLYMMGPVGVYMLTVLMRIKPQYVYIHAKTTIHDMDEWAQTHWKDTGTNFESDITGFDANCDHNTVKMFELFMRHLSIPEEYISYFINSKSNVITQFGVHFFATFSGEIFTYLINTCKTMARRHVKSIVPKGTPQMYTGDDEAHNAIYQDHARWREMAQYDGSVEKPLYPKVAGLASYYITSKGVFKDPVMLLRRYLTAVERGKLHDVFAGYYLEFLTVYDKSETIHHLMTEEQISAVQLMASEIFNVRRKTRLNIKFPASDRMKFDFLRPVLTSQGLNELADILQSSLFGSYTEDMSNTNTITSNESEQQPFAAHASWGGDWSSF